ncbi:hypothetical protein ACFV47_41470 [Streptomyces solisilvae]|uniref:hypothetical protein n=1 Tax=Streptomyces malaysiensis TaxID=92644 RepID=UPI0036A07732
MRDVLEPPGSRWAEGTASAPATVAATVAAAHHSAPHRPGASIDGLGPAHRAGPIHLGTGR